MKYAFVFIAVITLMSCQSDSPEPRQNDSCALEGTYTAYAEDGSTHYFSIEHDTLDANRFTLTHCPVVYPLVVLSGRLGEDGQLFFVPYSCQDCPGLPSPGGTPRYYTSSVEASGQCFGQKDSMVIDLKYELTGFITDSYDGLIQAVKSD